MTFTTVIGNTDILTKYRSVRRLSETLCEPLKVEDYVPQPAIFASPPKWHLGHTTWFFEELILKENIEGYKEFAPDFSYIFNSYYNSLGDRIFRANRGAVTRPSVSEVYEYRDYVDGKMAEWLENNEINDSILELLTLGLNHEQQHQELLITDLKFTLAQNPLFPIYRNDFILAESQNKEQPTWISIPEGLYEVGHQGKEFCYDNELGHHKVYLHDFEIHSNLVTNEAFIQFMEDGGYQRFELWLDEGWSWVNENQVEKPMYWIKKDNVWHQYTLGGLRPVNPKDLLTHINLYEAAAFAEWKGMRLPTEFEWEVAAEHFNWGQRWEWTNSAYLPYPGFSKAPGAVGEYNGKFMINQMVLRGASIATSPEHSRLTYRNFFHPHYRWQYTGIRLAK